MVSTEWNITALVLTFVVQLSPLLTIINNSLLTPGCLRGKGGSLEIMPTWQVGDKGLSKEGQVKDPESS